MASHRWSAMIVCAFVAAFGVSGVLYSRSRSAEFDRHARAVEAIGRIRQLDRLLSEQVLAARFGLLNQYDSINATESSLETADAELPPRIRDVVGKDSGLEGELRELAEAISAKRAAAETFKRENSILRNSTYYLPTAANEVVRPGGAGDHKPRSAAATSYAIEHVAQTGLAYNLIGDESARRAHAEAVSELRAQRETVPDDLRRSLDLLIAHAEVIASRVPAVDAWVAKVVSGDGSDKIDAVEAAYDARFDTIVVVSNRYRKVLYAWSLVLLVAVGLAGLQLRRLYAGLELRVGERTAELRDALAALWGEMKLARKIQEALVPVAPSLSGCEVAARMQPTDDVGGDYYDVIRMKDSEWILIGDVSGHGVPAGLIMMMCHTAVRTILSSNPDVGPDRLLALVNGVLTTNIHQLKEDKYMTITAFRRSPDGKVCFAGAHQDVHIYRAAKDAVETLQSSGLWLGLKDDISSALDVQEFRLDPGDILLLHTDGVTEASREGLMFDVGGLSSVLQRSGNKSASEVVGDVFTELETFVVTDDATVLAVKQL